MKPRQVLKVRKENPCYGSFPKKIQNCIPKLHRLFINLIKLILASLSFRLPNLTKNESGSQDQLAQAQRQAQSQPKIVDQTVDLVPVQV